MYYGGCSVQCGHRKWRGGERVSEREWTRRTCSCSSRPRAQPAAPGIAASPWPPFVSHVTRVSMSLLLLNSSISRSLLTHHTQQQSHRGRPIRTCSYRRAYDNLYMHIQFGFFGSTAGAGTLAGVTGVAGVAGVINPLSM